MTTTAQSLRSPVTSRLSIPQILEDLLLSAPANGRNPRPTTPHRPEADSAAWCARQRARICR